jgi:chromosome partitioning protein
MDIVAVINYKGGVGKTTTTANLGGQLAWIGKRVLLIDLDPQASLTFSFVQPDYWERSLSESRTIKRWFDAVVEDGEVDMNALLFEDMKVNRALRGRGRLALIPSHLGLINVDLELATKLGGATMKQVKRNYVKVHQRLARGLADLGQDAFDVVLIDCPPNFNIVTKNAIVASQYVLVPAKPDHLSTLGIIYLQRNLAELVSSFNEYATAEGGEVVAPINPQILGVLFTMVQFRSKKPITAHREYMRRIRAMDGVPVFDKYIRENKTLFGDTASKLLPVVLTRQTGSTYINIVDELEQITEEFAIRLGAEQGTLFE